MRSSAIQIKSLSEPYALPNSGLKQQLTQNQPITLEQIKIELTSGSWQQLPSEEQDKSFKALWLHNNKDHEAILPYLLEQRLSRQPASRLNIQEQKFLANLIKPNQDWPLDSFALLGEKQEIPLAICDLLLTKSQPKLMSCQKAIDIILQNHADGKQRLSEVLVKKITHAEFTQPRLYSTRPMDGKNCTYFKLAERYFKIAEWFLQNNYAHKLDIGGANALAEHYDPTIVAKAKAILTDYNAKQKPATTTSDLEHFAHISKEEQKKAVLASCQRLYELAGVEAGGRDIAFYHLRLLRRAWTLDKSLFSFKEKALITSYMEAENSTSLEQLLPLISPLTSLSSVLAKRLIEVIRDEEERTGAKIIAYLNKVKNWEEPDAAAQQLGQLSKSLNISHQNQRKLEGLIERLAKEGEFSVLTKKEDFATTALGIKPKTLKALGEELLELNPALKAKSPALAEEITAIESKAKAKSQLMPHLPIIGEYNRADCQNFVKALRALKPEARPLYKAELLAVIDQASLRAQGYKLRPAQQMALLLLLEQTPLNGRLLQVKTGEGKTLITAALAVTKALLKEMPIDIVTSSAVLASRDSEEMQEFYQTLGLKCSHNCYQQVSGLKQAYSSDIVYGDMLHFQADYLRTEFKGSNIRGLRGYSCMLVDEVDNMFIDQASKIAKLASPISGMEHLSSLFIFAGRFIEELKVSQEQIEDSKIYSEVKESVAKAIKHILEPGNGLLSVPKNLTNFASHQIDKWASSAVRAYQMQENVDYVVTKDRSGNQIIAPVDFRSTGVVQADTSWAEGLHQFLQVKHKLRLTTETLTTNFVSNMAYFQRYGELYGLTGTLGNDKDQELLSDLYKVDNIIMPTFAPKRFTEYQGQLFLSSEEQREAICTSSCAEAAKGRAVLIISENIAEGKSLHNMLASQHKGKLTKYLRADVDIFSGTLTSGEIVVATNLAGRGTDFITNQKIEEQGGLHVIVSFLPQNKRVEEQALGRTSRAGRGGSGALIINAKPYLRYVPEEKLSAILALIREGSWGVSDLRNWRDKIADERLDKAYRRDIPVMRFEDDLFQDFSKLYHQMRQQDDNQYKLRQLEDNWGFWLNRQKAKHKDWASLETQSQVQAEYEQFSKAMEAGYGGKGEHRFIDNPAYLSYYVASGLGNDSTYRHDISLTQNADNLDPVFAYPVHYLHAYCHLKYNGAQDKDTDAARQWKAESAVAAHQALAKALGTINSQVRPQLQSAMLQLLPEDAGTPLHRQLDDKLRLLETFAKNIQENCEYIASNMEGKDVLLRMFYQPVIIANLFKGQVNQADLEEFVSSGTPLMFNATSRGYSKDYLTGTLVGLAGIAQVVVGAMVAIGSAGFAANFGLGLAMGGVSDIAKGFNSALAGEKIDMGNWLSGKGIDLAVNLVMSTVTASLSKGKEVAKAGEAAGKTTSEAGKNVATASTSISTTASTAGGVITSVSELTAKEFGKQLAVRLIAGGLMDYAAKGLNKAAAKPIKAELERLKRAIYDQMRSPPTQKELVTSFYQDRALNKLGNDTTRSHFLNYINRILQQRSSDFSHIAQSFVSESLSGAATSSGHYGATAVIKVADAGLSVGRTVAKMQELEDIILTGLALEAAKRYKALPKFSNILHSRHGVPVLPARAIEEHLADKGILQPSALMTSREQAPKYLTGEILADKDFEGGWARVTPTLGQNRKSSANVIASPTSSTTNTTTSSTTSIAPQPYEYSDFTADELEEEALPFSQDELKEYELETKTLLSDMSKAHGNFGPDLTQLATDISNIVAKRMQGEIKNGIIQPISGAAFGAAASNIASWAVDRASEIMAKQPKTPPPTGSKFIPGISGVSSGEVEEAQLLQEKIKDVSALSDERLQQLESELIGWDYYLQGESALKDDYERAIVKECQKRFRGENTKDLLQLTQHPLMLKAIEKLTGKKIAPDEVDNAAMGSRLRGTRAIEKLAKELGLGKEPVPGAKAKLESTTSLSSKAFQPKGKGKLHEADLAGYKPESETTKATIERNTGITKPALIENPKTRQEKKYNKELEFIRQDLPALDKWPELPKYVNKLPKDLPKPEYARKGTGLRWEIKDKNGVHHVRIDKADLSAPYATQQVDHVAISYQSRVIDKTGKNYIVADDKKGVVYKVERNKYDKGFTKVEDGFDLRYDIRRNKPVNHPDSHIPAKEWYKWQDIFSPEKKK